MCRKLYRRLRGWLVAAIRRFDATGVSARQRCLDAEVARQLREIAAEQDL